MLFPFLFHALSSSHLSLIKITFTIFVHYTFWWTKWMFNLQCVKTAIHMLSNWSETNLGSRYHRYKPQLYPTVGGAPTEVLTNKRGDVTRNIHTEVNDELLHYWQDSVTSLEAFWQFLTLWKLPEGLIRNYTYGAKHACRSFVKSLKKKNIRWWILTSIRFQTQI